MHAQHSCTCSLFEHPLALDAWTSNWRTRLHGEARDPVEVATAMDGVNALYVPRNHLVEEALDAATNRDLTPFGRLLEIVTAPFDELAGSERFAEPAPESFDQTFQTYCGT